MEDITKKKHMSFKEIAAYSLGLFGFQAIVGLLNSYQAEFDGSILGAKRQRCCNSYLGCKDCFCRCRPCGW